MRVYCLALVGALGAINFSVLGQEASGGASDSLDRPGAYELVIEKSNNVDDMQNEDVQIFSPLSPVTVEAEPVKLPLDQSLDQ